MRLLRSIGRAARETRTDAPVPTLMAACEAVVYLGVLIVAGPRAPITGVPLIGAVGMALYAFVRARTVRLRRENAAHAQRVRSRELARKNPRWN